MDAKSKLLSHVRAAVTTGSEREIDAAVASFDAVMRDNRARRWDEMVERHREICADETARKRGRA